jgi:hypothetical protein
MTPNQLTTYQRNQHITILRAVLRVIGGPTISFGFGVRDFLAIGKIIRTIAV